MYKMKISNFDISSTWEVNHHSVRNLAGEAMSKMRIPTLLKMLAISIPVVSANWTYWLGEASKVYFPAMIVNNSADRS